MRLGWAPMGAFRVSAGCLVLSVVSFPPPPPQVQGLRAVFGFEMVASDGAQVKGAVRRNSRDAAGAAPGSEEGRSWLTTAAVESFSMCFSSLQESREGPACGT